MLDRLMMVLEVVSGGMGLFLVLGLILSGFSTRLKINDGVFYGIGVVVGVATFIINAYDGDVGWTVFSGLATVGWIWLWWKNRKDRRDASAESGS